MSDAFYEDDEPAADVKSAFERGEKGSTGRMITYTVYYGDPRRDNTPGKASHTLHKPGCSHTRDADRGVMPIEAPDLETAIRLAEHQGEDTNDEAMFIGDVDPAPCLK
ncbi:hypothetical protein O7635_29515 [Asanoa sp. WMMD1127]|uniref:hypothetical protein n=1 Tax=Asanoa sp. WMMD1127 TaxID=3016107 RepID=UPI002417D3EC|nr:hypothetical protein [Asanoa sp. WMMD1127]MDG4826008.1 hypothetical protein [Asanoa sp. WMMD1127]